MFRRFAVALLVVSVSPQLEAQTPRKGIAEVQPAPLRGGFWGSIGFGAGMERVDLDGDAFGYSDALWRPTFNFRLGGTVKQVLRLGGEVNVWTNYQNGITETLLTGDTAKKAKAAALAAVPGGTIERVETNA